MTQLSRNLQIPMSTVHSAATNLIAKGWLCDKPNPEDQRCRIISLSEQGVSGGLWQVALGWLNEYSDDGDGVTQAAQFAIQEEERA